MNDSDKQHIQDAIKEGIEKYVNGHIRELRKDMETANEAQDKKLTDILNAYNDASAFFRVLVLVAKFIIPVGTAFAMVWGAIRWLKG